MSVTQATKPSVEGGGFDQFEQGLSADYGFHSVTGPPGPLGFPVTEPALEGVTAKSIREVKHLMGNVRQ